MCVLLSSDAESLIVEMFRRLRSGDCTIRERTRVTPSAAIDVSVSKPFCVRKVSIPTPAVTVNAFHTFLWTKEALSCFSASISCSKPSCKSLCDSSSALRPSFSLLNASTLGSSAFRFSLRKKKGKPCQTRMEPEDDSQRAILELC